MRQLVDEIGGVTFDVPINMNYDDPAQNLYIHLKKGTQLLTGKKAEQLVRFRHNNDGSGYGNEDIGRIATQQKFIKTMAKEVLSAKNISKLGNLVKIALEGTKTDITMEVVAKYLAHQGFDILMQPLEYPYPSLYADIYAPGDLPVNSRFIAACWGASISRLSYVSEYPMLAIAVILLLILMASFTLTFMVAFLCGALTKLTVSSPAFKPLSVVGTMPTILFPATPICPRRF